jgi:nucleotide-binding universal stress UspA family protein
MLYKKILLAIDGSDISNLALHEALKLAINQNALLRLVNVVDEGTIYHGGPGFDYNLLISALRAEGQAILDHASDIIKNETSLPFETCLLELKPFQGRIAEMIVEEAKDWSADLLVIGTHGRRGFSHLFLGSVAEQIIRLATIPVLLIRGQHNK